MVANVLALGAVADFGALHFQLCTHFDRSTELDLISEPPLLGSCCWTKSAYADSFLKVPDFFYSQELLTTKISDHEKEIGFYPDSYRDWAGCCACSWVRKGGPYGMVAIRELPRIRSPDRFLLKKIQTQLWSTIPISTFRVRGSLWP